MMRKAQSAMEYLTTYGWAILIIVIVFAVLLQIGIFNRITSVPRAQPGACHVYRLTGPETVPYVNLEGTCSGELPQYVAQIGTASNVLLSDKPITTGNLFTWSLWVAPLSSGSQVPIAQQGGWTGIGLTWPTGDWFSIQPTSCSPSGTVTDSGASIPVGTWAYYSATYNGTVMTFYINGVSVGSTSFNGISGCGNVGAALGNTGSWVAHAYQFNGLISNVQIYNTSLSANDVKSLYQEGIGGAPIDLQNLVGWWALNGNANDYSGNLNNGVSTNVMYISSWTSNYTQP